MGLFSKNPCRSCEFEYKCTQPSMLRSYVTSADEDGCPHFAFLKQQSSINYDEYNAIGKENLDDYNADDSGPEIHFDLDGKGGGKSIFNLLGEDDSDSESIFNL